MDIAKKENAAKAAFFALFLLFFIRMVDPVVKQDNSEYSGARPKGELRHWFVAVQQTAI